MRQTRRTSTLTGLLVLAFAGCTYDPDDRCGEGQMMFGDGVRCVCEPGTTWTLDGCAACGENEVPGPDACLCADNFVRPEPGAACEAASPALGSECDTESAPCDDATYGHCQPLEGTAGYCTSSGCTDTAECPGGYACDTASSPTQCLRRPTGEGRACSSDADCAGTDATYCDTFVSHTCVVRDCSPAADDCFAGTACCDLSPLGLPETLCIPESDCPT